MPPPKPPPVIFGPAANVPTSQASQPAPLRLGPLAGLQSALATPQGFDPFIAQRYLDLVKDLGAQFQSNREFIFDVGNKRAFETLGVRYLMTGGNGEDTARLKADPEFADASAGLALAQSTLLARRHK